MIAFENVGLRYGHGPEILKDLTFAISPGSFHFLTGPSGSGKTSLLRLLLLSLKPTRGSVSMFGEDVTALDRDRLLQMRRHIGIVFQEFRLLDHLTTFENVALPLRVRGQAEASYRGNVEELLDWVRNNAETTYHPVGTCKMGNDPMAVVDNELKVHGIKQLRIADASIMPTLTSGNTNAPCIMIGEKCASMVLKDARL